MTPPSNMRGYAHAACIALVASSFTIAHAENHPVRINVAEGIISPFWDPWISDFDDWDVEAGEKHGLRVWQNWAAVDFEWKRTPENGRVLRMQRKYDAIVAEYGKLLMRATAPEGASIVLRAETDAGETTATHTATTGSNEYALDFEGANRLHTLTVELQSDDESGGAGWIEWIGVQNESRLEAYNRRWDYAGISWQRHIKSDEVSIEFEPKYGIFITPQELAAMRAEHEAAIAQGDGSRFTRLRDASPAYDFEAGIHEFAKSGGDAKGRMRDVDLAPLPGGTRLAEAAIVLQDRELMNAAARYALSLAASQYWDKDFRSHFPGGPADDRAFRRSYSCEDIAIILDLAGNVFTPAGERYLLRRLAEEGVGPINYVTWRHEYIHETNQLAYFNRGRMFAYLVLERTYPRVKPYTDLALQDTIDNIETAILPDGGYQEGATYFAAMARRNYDIIKKYARARDVDVTNLIPDRLRKTSNYIEAMASTTVDDVIPIGDSGRELGYNTLEAMVDLMPGSYWQTLLNKNLRKDGRPITAEGPAPQPFIPLPNLGMAASYRMLEGRPLKLLICGNAANADHAHEDKGSFVLEYGGEVFAMDPGSTSYSDPIHQLYKHCQRHNMLVPTGLDERPAPPIRLEHDVIPECRGDETAFWARMDLRPGWEPYYERWTRTWDAPNPATLTITDDYALKQGTGVEFYWQTTLPCEVDGSSVTISGEHGTLTLTVPPGCEVRVDRLPMAGDGECSRIGIAQDGKSGSLTIQVSIASYAGP